MKFRVAVLVAGVVAASAPALAQSQGRQLLAERESQYNSIYVYQQGPYVDMLFGYNTRLYTESRANTTDRSELPVEYTRFMTLAMGYAQNLNSVLEIGLGGGSTASYLHNTFDDIDITVAELDPVVAELTRQYFFLPQDDRLRVEIRDGRLFLVRSQDLYDAILVDAYRGPFVPFHLLTKEFFQLVEDHLAPGGAVAQNVEPTTMLYDSALATMKSVFDNVDVYQAFGNYVAVAYNGPAKTQQELAIQAATIDNKYDPRYPLLPMVSGRQVVRTTTGQVLTDDFAPVEMLNATERHNERLP